MDKKDLTKKYLSEVARDEKWISSRLMKIQKDLLNYNDDF